MKIPNFDDFINEFNSIYSFDGDVLNVGDSIICVDGSTGIIISKTTNDGFVLYKDQFGNTYKTESDYLIKVDCCSNEITESLNYNQSVLSLGQWYKIIKFVIIVDVLKGNGSGGGVLNTGGIFPKWRLCVIDIINKMKSDNDFSIIKAQSDKIADKFYNDSNINYLFNELYKYPYIDLKIKKNFIKKREYNRILEINNKRKEIIKKIADDIWLLFDIDDKKFVISCLDRINKLTEGVNMIGVGTYTPTNSINPLTWW